MKVARNTAVKRAPLAVRVFRFWFPLFLFVYLSYAKLVTLILPVSGPIALMGKGVPVPVGATNQGHVIWYQDLLRVEAWEKSLDGDLDRNGVRTWAELRELIQLFAQEMNVERGGFSLGRKQDLESLHEMLVKSVRAAQVQGLYQTFALERVDQIRSLIDLGIYFPDLAYQYSALPSAEAKGVRIFLYDELPESYREAIGKEEVMLVQTDAHYVFVKIEQLEENGGVAVQYRVTELGIAKQDLRETFYSYLLEHSVRWF